MKLVNPFEKKAIYILKYTAFFLLCWILLYGINIAAGLSFVANADGFNQYYPAYVYIGQYLRRAASSLIRGEGIPLYDFSIGFGNDIISTLSYYGLGDIFNVLSVFFREDLSEAGYGLSLFLKVYAAGLSFSYWAYKKYQSSSFFCIAAAVSYCYGSFSLSYGMQFPVFMTAIVYLPLIMSGLDDLLYDRIKISFLLIISVCLVSLNGFYLFYQILFFCAVYYFILSFTHSVRWQNAGRALLQMICGLALSGILLLPTIAAYIHSSRNGESSLLPLLNEAYSSEEFLERIAKLIQGPGYEAGLGLTVLMVLSVVMLFSRREEKCLRMLLIFFMVGYFIPFFGTMLNGFSYNTDRWVYLLNFLFCWSLLLEMPKIACASKGELTATGSLISALLILYCYLKRPDYRVLLGAGAVFMTFLLLALLCRKSKEIKRQSLMREIGTLEIVGVLIVGIFNNWPHVTGGQGHFRDYQVSGIYQRIMQSSFAKESSAISQNGNDRDRFERFDLYDSSLGASLVTGTFGTTSYFSISNSYISSFMEQYLFTDSIQGSYILQGLDSRQNAESLLSVREYASGGNLSDITINDRYLPMGILFDSYVPEEDASTWDPLTRNASLLKTVILKESSDTDFKLCDSEVRKSSDSDFSHSWEEVPFRKENQGGGKILLKFDTDKVSGGELYVFLHNMSYTGEEDYEDIMIENRRARISRYSRFQPVSDFLVHVPVTDAVQKQGGIQIQMPDYNVCRYDSIEIRYISEEEENMESDISGLGSLRLLSSGENGFTGLASTDRNAVLFMSIPYDSAWRCRIDGANTEVYCADYGFSAVIVPAGTHAIEWEYRPFWVYIGAAVSLVALVVFIVAAISEASHKDQDAVAP